MDDLLGEDWQKPSKPSTTTTSSNPPLNQSNFNSNYSSFRASPALSQSGTASPQNISRPSSTINGAPKTLAATGDQFGSLLSLKSQKGTASNVSMQERQRQILEEKSRQQSQNAALWDTLGSGRGTPEMRGPSPAQPQMAEESEDDILAAFNRAAPVDKASHFPPPTSGVASGRSTPAVQQAPPTRDLANGSFGDDDDDPFGLGSMPQRTNGHTSAKPMRQVDDDDILGDLGRPVTERLKPVTAGSLPEAETDFIPGGGEPDDDGSPRDRSLAELVEMGFPADNAKLALAESGGDVQGAVGWLLQQAHEESRQKARTEAGERRRSPPAISRSPQRKARADQEALPAWSRPDSRPSSAARRQDTRSPVNGEKDASQMAQDYGSKFLKGASSLWKASQKQMAKTMAEFQQEREPNQPKWMHDASSDNSRSSSQRRQDGDRPRAAPKRDADVTDEAAMLDAPRERPQKPSRPATNEKILTQPPRERTPVEPPTQRLASQPRLVQHAPPVPDKRPTSKLSRMEVEEQSAQAYVSPARRKKATPKPELPPEPEVDLFSPAPAKPAQVSSKPAQAVSSPRPTPDSTPVRPKAPPRNIPDVSPAALSTSANHRKVGGEAFKRGDYASAHESYTAALTPLPSTHPIAIVVYTNRALTGIKTGDAKTAVADADQALTIIGVSQGVGETIDLGGGEGAKEMRDFYGKALMRKAEALEHMEKWSEAASVYRAAVSAGVGGALSLRGRDRCEKAAAPKPAPTAVRPAPRPAPSSLATRAPPAKSLGNSLTRPTLSSASSAEAVKKLRAANLAAERADDEKFALTDQVDARLTAWKGGKADNLRALLQSLDGVLWPAAGWKKVGMSDLVMPNKVKIVYMKAIAKVHPDKIPQDATTEQRMVSGAVFSTLNEAWDKFKRDNNL